MNINEARELNVGDIIVHKFLKTEWEVVEAKPTPLIMMFEVISQVAGVQEKGKFLQLKSLGVDPSKVSLIRVYGDEESQQNFKKYLGTDKEEKYYGTLYQEKKLIFDAGLSDDDDMSRILSAIESSYPEISKDELLQKSLVRGSEVRASIQSKDPAKISRFLPPVLNKKEKEKVIAILYKGLEESAIRSLIRKIIMGD